MTLFELVKQTVSVRDAAEYYGLQVNRSCMCRYPFHDEARQHDAESGVLLLLQLQGHR